MKTINNEKIGKTISILRKKQRYTQRELANKIGVSDKAVSKWERGLGLPDISLFSTLAMALDSDIDSILSGNSEILKKEKWKGLLDLSNAKIKIDSEIGAKSLLSYQLGYFLLAGINEIYVICNDIEKKYIVKETKNINIKTVFIDETFNIKDNLMVIYYPLFIYGQNITRSFQKCMEIRDGISIISLPEQTSNNVNILYNSNHKVINNINDSIETSYKYSAAPIMFFPKKYIKYYNNCAFNEYIDYLINNNILYTEPLFRGIIYIPLKTKTDIKDADRIVNIIEKRDYLVGDLEEIQRRRGLK